MKTTILQPTYLPWLGYFEMLDACEQFVIFDHVQFEPKSWQQRNRIKAPNGELMLSVPVLSDGRQDVRICDKRVDNKQPWRKKHVRSIEVAYQKAPHFERYFQGIAEVLGGRQDLLVDLNQALIELLCGFLGIKTRFRRSSQIIDAGVMPVGTTERVVDLCVRAGVTTLYDGAAAESFLDLQQFRAKGVSIVFQKYVHPNYAQLHGAFVPYMSVVDLLMNRGEESLAVIRSGVTR